VKAVILLVVSAYISCLISLKKETFPRFSRHEGKGLIDVLKSKVFITIKLCTMKLTAVATSSSWLGLIQLIFSLFLLGLGGRIKPILVNLSGSVYFSVCG